STYIILGKLQRAMISNFNESMPHDYTFVKSVRHVFLHCCHAIGLFNTILSTKSLTYGQIYYILVI
ncbi:MAG: hypothetical protein KAI26_09795, partial [Nanoarchaeota archaeon]|nr:hypothetical protein [Nanoarchaeota archaeon]